MKMSRFASVALALVLTACSGNHLSSGVRTVSVAPSAKSNPVVLAPQRANTFSRMAQDRNAWAVNHLRNSISQQLDAGGRFQAKASGAGDAEIAIESLRHGLIEVSANAYAVTVSGSAQITEGKKSLGSREFAGTGGDIRSLLEFEDPKNYEAAMQSVLDKIAIEIVAGL